MPFWPFKRNPPKELSPNEIRDELIGAAASGNRRKLIAACNKNKYQVARNIELMIKLPEGAPKDPTSIQNYIQCLGAVAECLANECSAPELWNRLTGTTEDNPLLRWQAWFTDLPQRTARLEYPVLIEEARQFIEDVQSTQGPAALKYQIYFKGRLGELLFHSGKVADAIEPFHDCVRLCREISDVEGELIYLKNLVEANRYLGRVDEAVRIGEEVIALSEQKQIDCEEVRSIVQKMRAGEPLCRIVIRKDGKEFELENFAPTADGNYQFEFRRNHATLQLAIALVDQGKQLASSGQFADALEKFHAASEVDPHDPDPAYQSGMCLMEMGLHAKARETFEEVERLAPGWFRCRFDRWMAEMLETGNVSEIEFQLTRFLEDGGLPPDKQRLTALKAVEDYPKFAPFYLFLGDAHRNQGDHNKAIDAYRKGLELVQEPDLESRLLCSLAGALPHDSPERVELVNRAVQLNGSLSAKAMAAFIPKGK